MKVAERLHQRRQQWRELEALADQLQRRRVRQLPPEQISRFAALYRAACADLSLADAYHLPPATVHYLHNLVGRAHNQLYRCRYFNVRSWAHTLLSETPRAIFHDGCVQLAFVLFWGVFALAGICAYAENTWPQFAEQLLSANMIEQLERDFERPPGSRQPDMDFMMAGYYIRHNTSIGLRCFAGGLLVLPGLLVTIFNAAHLGAVFGYMARPDVAHGTYFFQFVTAHGPFELTAIVLSAAAGLKLGWSWIATGGRSRLASLQQTTYQAMPLMGAAVVMFALAAMIEAFISAAAIPYIVKAGMAIFSSALLMFYFIVLGYPRASTTSAGAGV